MAKVWQISVFETLAKSLGESIESASLVHSSELRKLLNSVNYYTVCVFAPQAMKNHSREMKPESNKSFCSTAFQLH